MPTMPVRSRHRLALGAPLHWWRGPRWQRGRWSIAFAGVVAAVALLATVVARAHDVIDGYATLRRVPVATHDVDEGHRIDAGDVVWRELPVAAIPDGALRAAPTGRVATDRVGKGDVYTDRRVAPGGLSGLAAMVPPGERAVGVPLGDGSVTVQIGDRVDVLAPGRDGSDIDLPSRSGAELVARRARVLAVTRSAVVLAVSADEVASVAGALAQGVPVLVLDGPT